VLISADQCCSAGGVGDDQIQEQTDEHITRC